MISYPIAFRRQLKEIVELENNYTRQDSKIDRCIAVATAWVENQIDRKLTKQEFTEYQSTTRNTGTYLSYHSDSYSGTYDRVNPSTITLKNYPVDSTATFKVYFDPTGAFDVSSEIDSSYYTVDYEKGKLYLSYPVGAYRRSLKIVYTAGYEYSVDTDMGIVEDPSEVQEKTLANSIHPDLLQACLWQAAHIYTKQYIASINVRDATGQGSTNTTRFVNTQGVSPEAASLLVKHRRVRMKVI